MESTDLNSKDNKHQFKIVLSGDTLIQQPEIKPYIDEIQSLTALPNEHFALFYAAPIKNFLFITQYFNQDDISLRFKSIITALKLRRSIILPEKANSDSIKDQKDIWTYVVFAIALMYDIAKTFNKKVIYKDTLTEKGKIYQWFPFNTNIKAGYYFTSLEKVVISPYASSALIPLIFNPLCLSWLYKDINAFNNTIELITFPSKKTVLGKLFYKSHYIQDKQLPIIKSEVKVKTSTHTTSTALKTPTTPESQGKLFYNWLVKKITEKENFLNNYIYNTIDGPALISPDIFQYYAKSNDLDWELVEKAFMLLDYHHQNTQKLSLPGQSTKNLIFLNEVKLPVKEV